MIRLATVEDIPKLCTLAQEFASSTEFVKGFDKDRFIANWTHFIKQCGIIFILNEFDGMLGGIKYPDINSGTMTAAECFWFVSPLKRGEGMKLLTAFEQWAKDNECKSVIMVHLMDSMPEKLQTVYKRNGYKAAEIHYVKEL